MTRNSIFDHPIISSRYFFPRDDAPPRSTWVDTQAARLACARFERGIHRVTVIHFHGNGEVVADYIPEFTGKANTTSSSPSRSISCL